MNYTKNMGLRKPEGGEYYSIEDFNNNVDTLDAVVSGKADKPISFTQGNLAAVGANGSLADSGNKPADFAETEHRHDAAYAPISHVSDKTVHVNANEKAAIASMGSKADRTYVDSVLSTKLNAPQEIPADADLNNYKTPGMYYCSLNATSATIQNNPTDKGFSLLVERGLAGGVVQTLTSGTADLKGSVTFKRVEYIVTNDYGWRKWDKLAIAELPEFFTVKPSINITGGAITVSKDQFNKVWLHFGLLIGSLVLHEGTIIGTLPEGFRPLALIDLPIVVSRPDVHAGLIEINEEGQIKALSGCNNAVSISCNQYFFGA